MDHVIYSPAPQLRNVKKDRRFKYQYVNIVWFQILVKWRNWCLRSMSITCIKNACFLMLIGLFGIFKLLKVCWFLMIINILNDAFWQTNYCNYQFFKTKNCNNLFSRPKNFELLLRESKNIAMFYCVSLPFLYDFSLFRMWISARAVKI